MNLINEIKMDYELQKCNYMDMLDYYNGNHNIFKNYRYEANRSNQHICVNYIHKFVEEELAYIFGNPVTYISKDGNKNVTKAIDYELFHWKDTHNQELARQVEIFGTAYELYYINADGLFSSKILNPINAAVYTDTDGNPEIFMHFYSKKFDNDTYYDVYYNDRIEIYKNDTLIETKSNIFNKVPVSICTIGKEQTIYSKIKDLNNSLNSIMSDQINTISDYRTAYLIVTGCNVDDETETELRSKGILNLKSKESNVSWLTKDVNAEYIHNMMKSLIDAMFSVTNHIDGNEKLQSNTSGIALRTRLIFLEQRCKTVFDTLANTISDRINFLFSYLNMKNLDYDYRDITINYTPCIPQDLVTTAQTITQLNGVISNETALSLLPFIENPSIEMDKIRKEQSEMDSINLEKLGLGNEQG